jgi:nitrogen fixation NifU-like protein
MNHESAEFEELYQQVILDHSKRPRNFGELPDAVRVHGDNPSCGDEIDLFVKFDAEGNPAELKFLGQSCAICRASASLMTMKLKGKPRAEAVRLMHNFHKLVTGAGEADSQGLGDLTLLSGVRKFPQRVKCAMLAWRAFEQALSEVGGVVTTEGGE